MSQIADALKEALRHPFIFVMEFIGVCALLFIFWLIMVVGYSITG